MSPSPDTAVSPRERNQITITLSDRALEEYELIAQWKGQPLASLLREILEQHHLNPAVKSAVDRAKRGLGIDESGG